MAKEERILVIDDEHFSREYFQKILEKSRFTVKTASNGVRGKSIPLMNLPLIL